MKKTLTLLCLAASLASVHAAAVLVDFNDNLSTSTSLDYYNQVTVDDRTDIALKTSTQLDTNVTLTMTMSAGTLVSSGESGMRANLPANSWTTSADNGKFDAPTYVQNALDLEEAFSTNAWSDSLYSQNKVTGNITITLSGFVAGNSYGLYVFLGVPFEGPGNWCSLNLAADNIGTNTTLSYSQANTGADMVTYVNGSTQISPGQGGTSAASFLELKDAVADENGNIVFSIANNNGGQRININGLAISGVDAMIPEPATASLSLLGLTALMLRRRR